MCFFRTKYTLRFSKVEFLYSFHQYPILFASKHICSVLAWTDWKDAIFDNCQRYHIIFDRLLLNYKSIIYIDIWIFLEDECSREKKMVLWYLVNRNLIRKATEPHIAAHCVVRFQAVPDVSSCQMSAYQAAVLRLFDLIAVCRQKKVQSSTRRSYTKTMGLTRQQIASHRWWLGLHTSPVPHACVAFALSLYTHESTFRQAHSSVDLRNGGSSHSRLSPMQIVLNSWWIYFKLIAYTVSILVCVMCAKC